MQIFLVCRYGDEDRLVSLMGVMQALVAFVQDSEGKGMNNMQCIVAGDHRCVFFVREHLTLVAVSRTRESTQQLVLQLIYLYNQILSILTLSRINHVFQQRRNYDLRRLLTGADRFLNNLLQLIDTDPSFLLGAVKCLPLDYSVRDTIIQTMLQHAKVKVRHKLLNIIAYITKRTSINICIVMYFYILKYC